MSKKKPTKAQTEATEKAALRQRLKDIALGAYGPFIDPPDFDNTECCLSCRMGSDAFYRWRTSSTHTGCGREEVK